MLGIELNELIVIVLGLLGAGILVVIERMNATRSAEIEMLLKGVANQADKLLAGYGDRLKPIYDLASTAETLIDEESDLAVQQLPPDVISAAQLIIDFAQRFTDGEPPQEHAVNPIDQPDIKGTAELQ